MDVYHKLVRDEYFRKFCGYTILPRDDNSYYFVEEPTTGVTVAVRYFSPKRVSYHTQNRALLAQSLEARFPGRAKQEVQRILDHMRDLVSFVSEESILTVYSSVDSSGSATCSIESRLSEDQWLHFSPHGSNRLPPARVAIVIDTSWIYVSKSP